MQRNGDSLPPEFHSGLTLPIKPTQLLEHLQQALFQVTLPVVTSPAPMNPAPSLPDQPSLQATQASNPELATDAFRILVVDDNAVNRKLAKSLLNKFGYFAIDMAENGQLAVESFGEHPYHLILMDCQMPIMDGFIATRLIRSAEQKSQVHTPIVAMTANAIHGDRERCIDAGMDDYLAKPIGPKALQEMLKRWLPEINRPQTGLEANSSSAATMDDLHAILNPDRANEICGGDMILYAEIVNVFIDQTPPILNRIEQAVIQQNYAAIKAGAHELAGSASNIGADQLDTLAKKLEQASQVPNGILCKQLHKSIGTAFTHLVQATPLRGTASSTNTDRH